MMGGVRGVGENAERSGCVDNFWLISFAVAMTVGQLLFKQAANAIGGRAGGSAVGALLASPALWLALVVYGGATVSWIWILTRVPLSRAYPFAALAMILVPLASVLIYGERVKPLFWLGSLLVIAGIVVAQRNVG